MGKIMYAVLGTMVAGSVWASVAGWGVPKPTKEPMSVREGSTRDQGNNRHGHYRHHFIGGGLHGGK